LETIAFSFHPFVSGREFDSDVEEVPERLGDEPDVHYLDEPDTVTCAIEAAFVVAMLAPWLANLIAEGEVSRAAPGKPAA
jgi:hypothetical protein